MCCLYFVNVVSSCLFVVCILQFSCFQISVFRIWMSFFSFKCLSYFFLFFFLSCIWQSNEMHGADFFVVEGCTLLMFIATLSSQCLFCSMVTVPLPCFCFPFLLGSARFVPVTDVLFSWQWYITFCHRFWWPMVSSLYCYQTCFSWWRLLTTIILTF